MPFDFVKTQCQKAACINDSTFKILKKSYRINGLKTLYTGWQYRMIQYFTQSLFTVSTLDILENKAKKL